jgi:hypothetical protein
MRRIVTIATATAALVVGMAIPAVAQGKPALKETPRTPATECLQAGQEFLKDAGLFQLAAQNKIDYAPLMDAAAGPIFIDAETVEGIFGTTYLPISTVFQLHLDAPGLFAWCSA